MKPFQRKNISKQLGNDKMNIRLLAFLVHFNYTVHHGPLFLEQISIISLVKLFQPELVLLASFRQNHLKVCIIDMT